MPARALSISLAGACLLVGCAHKAAHFAAPDAQPLIAKQHEVTQHAGEARAQAAGATAAVAKAAAAHGRSIAFHKAEGEVILLGNCFFARRTGHAQTVDQRRGVRGSLRQAKHRQRGNQNTCERKQ